MDLDNVLHGNTLRIYLHMLKKKKPLGVREIMRELGFSTPSLVHYHLNKLLNAGLIEQDGSKYIVYKPVKIGIVKYSTIIFGKVLPRFSLYAGFFLAILIFNIFLFLYQQLIVLAIFSIFSLFLAFLIMLVETINLWNDLKKYYRITEK